MSKSSPFLWSGFWNKYFLAEENVVAEIEY
jgi:hypothetical protein